MVGPGSRVRPPNLERQEVLISLYSPLTAIQASSSITTRKSVHRERRKPCEHSLSVEHLLLTSYGFVAFGLAHHQMRVLDLSG